MTDRPMPPTGPGKVRPTGPPPDPASDQEGPSPESRIPADHPRAQSLRVRERMKEAVEAGLVHGTGLIAHGRGEAFDYLLGERTQPEAREAIRAAARRLLAARHPVLSLNGNVVALAASECVALAAALPGLRLEVNLFHRTEARVRRLVRAMEKAGAPAGSVLGTAPDATIPGLSSDRARCCQAGIGDADVVLVPLEDGDRCEALKAMGKTVITVDLNPLSRTARTADITIVDELTRALPALRDELVHLQDPTRGAGGEDTDGGDPGGGGPGGGYRPFDNRANLAHVRERMAASLRRPDGND